MLLMLLNCVVLRALWKIDVYLIVDRPNYQVGLIAELYCILDSTF